MKKITFIFALLCASVMGFAIDWSGISYVGCDAGGEAYASKFKVQKADGQNVASIQNFKGAGWGIYTSFNGKGAITSVSGVSSYEVEGAGVCLHCSAFDAGETAVTVTCASGSFNFTVYKEADSGSGSSTKESECFGSKGHFGTPNVKNVYYQIDYADNKAIFSLRSLTGHDLDFAEVQIMGVGSYAMTADGNGGYTYTINNPAVNAEWYIRFLYSDTNMPGNEMTAQNLSTTDANIIYYKVGECTAVKIENSNIALSSTGATATASTGVASVAIDDNTGSRWESAHKSDPQWICVDFGERRLFNKVQLVHEGAYIKTYDIQISDNGTDFLTIKHVSESLSGFPNTQTIDLGANYAAQYVRIYGTERGETNYGYSLWEFRVMYSTTPVLTTYSASLPSRFATIGSDYQIQIIAKDQLGNDFPVSSTYSIEPAAAGTITIAGVYTPAQAGTATITAQGGGKFSSFEVRNEISANLAFEKAVTSGHDAAAGYAASLANNSNLSDRWASGEAAVHYRGGTNPDFEDWWYVDLGGYYDIAEIAIKWETARPNDYDIRISNDATSWTNLGVYDTYPAANGDKDMNYQYYNSLASTPGRYVGVWAREGYGNPSLQWGISMYDFQVFGQEHVDAGVDVTGITMSQNAATIEMGEPLTITAEVEPFNATDKEIVWTSTNESVATVVGGVITTVAPGTTTIRATAHDGSGQYDECALTVEAIAAKTCWGAGNDFTYQENTISYNYSITRNADRTLTYFVEFSGAVDGMVKEVNVHGDGVYKPMTYDSENKTATFTTTELFTKDQVVEGFFWFNANRTDYSYTVASVCAKSTVDVTSVEINHDALTLTIGENSTVTASVVPANSDDKEIIWTNSNPTVASFNEATGEVVALALGTTTITAKSHFDESIYATCVVEVIEELTPATWYGYGTFTPSEGLTGFTYSITRNADRSLTYTVVLDKDPVGFVGEVNIKDDGNYSGMTYTASTRTATYTTAANYAADGDVLAHSFWWLKFSGGVNRIDFSYTVGSENAAMPQAVAFDDTKNNESAITNHAGEDVLAVVSRTFPNTTEWYTLCLPFDLSDEQLTDVFGTGYTLAELVSSEDRGSLIHLNFDYSPEFKAGKAYLLRPGTGVTSAPTFNGVVIKNVDPEDEASISTHMHFQGTFDYITLNQANQRFVGPENYLYSPDPNGTHMKAFRCYFTIPANAQNNVMGKRAKIVFGPQATTEIENVSEQAAPAKFMMDGVLYIIRDGKTYNAQGMLVK